MASFAAIPPVTPLERIGPKGYLRYVFPFGLEENYDLEHVADILRKGYAATKKRLGTLRCEAIPDPSAGQAGVLKLVEMTDGAIEDIAVKDLRETFPSTHAELRAKHFPVSAFDGPTVMRRSIWPSAGERLPVLLTQANFIQDGMILTWCILHVFGDGTTFYQWMRVWAEECRRVQGDTSNPVVFDEEMFSDRETLMRPSGRNKGNPEDHPEYTNLSFTPTGAPPKMQSEKHRGQVFYFPPETLKRLKADAQPKDGRVSTNDAVSALVWRTVMAVQYSELANLPASTSLGPRSDSPKSVFNIAIDARRRTNPPIHPATLGCFLAYVACSAPISWMLSPTTKLSDLAVLVRHVVRKADKEWTDDITTLISKQEDVDRIVATAFLDVPGYNCVQSSWVGFELYGLDWGKALGGKIESMRCPSVGVINGLQVVLPVLPDGGVEIMVGVEEGCLERVMADEIWMKYAEAR